MARKNALFLGCTIEARARNYEMATRKVAEVLGIELVTVDDFACCGFPLKAVDQVTTAAMAARNLAYAEAADVNIVTLCSACTGFITETNHHIKSDDSFKEAVNGHLKEIGLKYDGTVEVTHFTRLLAGMDAGTLAAKMTRSLEGLGFAPHYGCHYLKPSEIYNDVEDPENPESLDRLIGLTGAASVQYEDKLTCCGGAVLAMDEKVALGLSNRKLKNVKEKNADALVLVCPFCSVMYDDNQKKIEAMFEEEHNLPVLYLPQVLGLAMGIPPKELGFNLNKVKTKELVKKFEGLHAE